MMGLRATRREAPPLLQRAEAGGARACCAAGRCADPSAPSAAATSAFYALFGLLGAPGNPGWSQGAEQARGGLPTGGPRACSWRPCRPTALSSCSTDAVRSSNAGSRGRPLCTGVCCCWFCCQAASLHGCASSLSCKLPPRSGGAGVQGRRAAAPPSRGARGVQALLGVLVVVGGGGSAPVCCRLRPARSWR